jgi:hypothetical protein
MKITTFRLRGAPTVRWQRWTTLGGKLRHRAVYIGEQAIALAHEPAPWNSWADGAVIPVAGDWFWNLDDGHSPVGPYTSEQEAAADAQRFVEFMKFDADRVWAADSSIPIVATLANGCDEYDDDEQEPGR